MQGFRRGGNVSSSVAVRTACKIAVLAAELTARRCEVTLSPGVAEAAVWDGGDAGVQRPILMSVAGGSDSRQTDERKAREAACSILVDAYDELLKIPGLSEADRASFLKDRTTAARIARRPRVALAPEAWRAERR